MTTSIASIIGKTEKEAAQLIARLEALSGHPSEDIRLLAEIKSVLRGKTRDLGLDPDNTSGEELHHALLLRMKRDDLSFNRAIGVDSNTPADNFNKIIISLSRHLLAADEVIALKKSTAKELLRQHPPTRLMKILKCRSVDSMLKRENIAELFAAAAFTESKRWHNGFWSSHSKLEMSDFETRKVELIVMPDRRWADVTPRTGLLSCLFQLGAVAVWPTRRHGNSSLTMTLMLLEAVEIMGYYSASLRARRYNPNFGKLLLSRLQADLHSPIVIEGLPVPWSVFHRHYGRTDHPVPDILQDYLEGDALRPTKSHERLAALNPAFGWWADSHHVAALDGAGPVSLNLADVTLGALNGTAYENRIIHNLSGSFVVELLCRYLKHPGVENHMLSGLDTLASAVDARRINIFNKHDNNFANKMEMA